MNNALNNTAANNGNTVRRNILLALGGLGVAAALSACGTSADETAAVATPVPAAEAVQVATDVIDQTGATLTAETPAPAATPAPAPATPASPPTPAATPATDTDVWETAARHDLPCESYTEATALPLRPCTKGELVKDFQRYVAYADDTFVVDGFFGPDTFEAVTGYQLSFQMLDTGVIDQQLMDMMDLSMNHAEPIDDEWADDEYIEDWHGVEPGWVDDDQFDNVHDITEWESCEILRQDLFAFGDTVSDEQVRVCDDLGLPLFGE